MNTRHTASRVGRLCATLESTELALILWLAAFSTLTVLLAVIQPSLADWPLIAGPLLLTAVMVSLLQFVLVPRRVRCAGLASG